MKHFYIMLIVMGAVLISCSPEANETTLDATQRGLDLPGIDPGTVGGTTVLEETELTAGQNIDAGTVTVVLENGNLVITYTTSGDWYIDETHLFVGDLADLPTNGGGNPRIGHFPYSSTNGPGTVTVVYTLPALAPGECVYVAAHAVVIDAVTGQEETAWGNGEPIGGNSWAMMFEVCA